MREKNSLIFTHTKKNEEEKEYDANLIINRETNKLIRKEQKRIQ